MYINESHPLVKTVDNDITYAYIYIYLVICSSDEIASLVLLSSCYCRPEIVSDSAFDDSANTAADKLKRSMYLLTLMVKYQKP